MARKVGGRPIILEDRVSLFGLVPQIILCSGTGTGYHEAGQWAVGLWENGFKKMRFFHPELSYKEYQLYMMK